MTLRRGGGCRWEGEQAGCQGATSFPGRRIHGSRQLGGMSYDNQPLGHRTTTDPWLAEPPICRQAGAGCEEVMLVYSTTR